MDPIEKKRIEAERDRLMKVWQERGKKSMDDVKTFGDFRSMKDDDTKFFWHYEEADCWITSGVVSIPSIDKANSILWRGDCYVSTEIFSTMVPYTVDEYHQNFCTLNETSGKWIYKG